MRSLLVGLLILCSASGAAAADPLSCDLGAYTAHPELTARMDDAALVVGWMGAGNTRLQIRFVVDDGRPTVRELAIRSEGGWVTLAEGLTPELHITSGVRRLSNQQADPLRALGVEITPEVVDREKWYAFWDAPLVVPGLRAGQRPRNLGLPRSADEIRQASAVFRTDACTVRTDGSRLEVQFPGLSAGIFRGALRFTVYRGTNLIRMEAVASTDEPSVAYKYAAGLSGLSTDRFRRLVWRDTGGHEQHYRFGGADNAGRVAVRAANRLLIAEGDAGSLATFPPPHAFFFSREVETNLGYVWYRKDSPARFGLGIRQGDREETPEYVENFALYNAPPGTQQRMAVYFYASGGAAPAARQAALAFTRGDRFKAIAGYKTMVNHFHLRFTERLRAQGSLDGQLPDLVAMKALGLNIVGLSDFHGDLRGDDSGAGRYADQRDYGLASQRASDVDFLVTPWEEPSAYFGGHYNTLFPATVYWTKVREPGQPFTERDPVYGTVYHVGDTADMQRLLEAEDGYWFHAHPRTKGTTGYPDAILDTPWVRSDRYLGIAFKPGMGRDLSARRLCEYRCFDALDVMNNALAGSGLRPKYLVADVDTYRKGPDDDLYPNFPVNYLRLDTVPGPEDDWSPVLAALREGAFFVTTGEILIPSYRVEGVGSRRTVVAEVEWTFPLDYVEIVWGDGQRVDRQIVSATDRPPFGSARLALPFDAAGKQWVRLAIWDSAGNGAFTQPQWLHPPALPPVGSPSPSR